MSPIGVNNYEGARNVAGQNQRPPPGACEGHTTEEFAAVPLVDRLVHSSPPSGTSGLSVTRVRGGAAVYSRFEWTADPYAWPARTPCNPWSSS